MRGGESNQSHTALNGRAETRRFAKNPAPSQRSASSFGAKTQERLPRHQFPHFPVPPGGSRQTTDPEAPSSPPASPLQGGGPGAVLVGTDGAMQGGDGPWGGAGDLDLSPTGSQSHSVLEAPLGSGGPGWGPGPNLVWKKTGKSSCSRRAEDTCLPRRVASFRAAVPTLPGTRDQCSCETLVPDDLGWSQGCKCR